MTKIIPVETCALLASLAPAYKWVRHGIYWGPWCNRYTGEIEYSYYFYWWNWLPPESRYWGIERIYYDGVHCTFGFWFFNWSWSTKWTKPPPSELKT